MAYVDYFGDIAPIPQPVTWDGGEHLVHFRLLDEEEEEELASEVVQFPPENRIGAERRLRMARSIYMVNGAVVQFSDDPDEELAERKAWTKRFLGPLLWELSRKYEDASWVPITKLGEMRADPNSGAAPGTPGAWSRPEDAGQE